jgi:tetratricopeptide (TPR) repeat protein
VAQQVASHLRFKLDPAQQARLARHGTTNALAYEYYLKGLQLFDQRLSMTDAQRANMIDLFTKAIELDPDFAQAHAQLGYVFAISAVFRHSSDDAEVYRRARAGIERAEALAPELPEIALARFQLLASRFEGFQLATAVRVVLEAQKVDPSIGHAELGYLYGHMGLADEAEHALQRALDIDPTSAFSQGLLLDLYDWGSARYDKWLEVHQRYERSTPISPWYYLGTGRLDDAQRAIDGGAPSNAASGLVDSGAMAVLTALRGDARAAENVIPSFIARHPVKDPFYHHDAAVIAAIYAINGKSADAVKWLREAEAAGFAPYPMYERGRFFDRIRTSPDFVQFMAELKATVERYRREFSH